MSFAFSIVNAFVKVLFPTKCLICGNFYCVNKHPDAFLSSPDRDLAESFHQLMAPILCPVCAQNYLPVQAPICPMCGMMFKSREGEDHICGECITSPKKFEIARASGIYDHSLLKVIHCLKYGGKIQLARPLGVLLFMAYRKMWDNHRIDLVIPVPLHLKRLKKRGFNQAYQLVRDWNNLAKILDPQSPAVQIDRRALIRHKKTEPQTGLGRKERITNMKNAFTVCDTSKIEGEKILLVDDVYTTGATVNECAKALLRAGAANVDVLTLARAL